MRRKAFILACKNYDINIPSNKFESLDNINRRTKAFKQLLLFYGFEIEKVLINDENKYSFDSIQEKIMNFIENSDSQMKLFLYLGHGVCSEHWSEPYMIIPDHLNNVYEAIPVQKIYLAMHNRVEQNILIIDCCRKAGEITNINKKELDDLSVLMPNSKNNTLLVYSTLPESDSYTRSNFIENIIANLKTNCSENVLSLLLKSQEGINEYSKQVIETRNINKGFDITLSIEKTSSFLKALPIFVQGYDSISAFYIHDIPVTNEEYCKSQGRNCDNCNPPNNNTEKEACKDLPWTMNNNIDKMQTYCDWLNNKYNLRPDYHFRLPTINEWHWAAIGGVKTKSFTYAGTNNSAEIININSSGGTIKKVRNIGVNNELEIRQMSGNVYELCQDNDNYKIAGGSYMSNDNDCKINGVYKNYSDVLPRYIGIRLCRSIPK